MPNKILILSTSMLMLSSCAITRPLPESSAVSAFAPCQWTPNCVSTETTNNKKLVEPFELRVDLDAAWPKIVTAVESLRGATIVQQRLGYLYAKHYSSVFKFVDYFEVLHVPEGNRLAIRSSSRLGLSDMGVNRKRVERLRTLLLEQALIRQ